MLTLYLQWLLRCVVAPRCLGGLCEWDPPTLSDRGNQSNAQVGKFRNSTLDLQRGQFATIFEAEYYHALILAHRDTDCLYWYHLNYHSCLY